MNSKVSVGGAVYITNMFAITVHSVVVSDCNARNGEGVSILNTSTVIVTGSHFLNSNALNIGGALLIDDAKTVTIKGCRFIDNTATNFGGSISINSIRRSCVINDNYFLGSHSRFGAAVMMQSCYASIISENVFSGSDVWLRSSSWRKKSGVSCK